MKKAKLIACLSLSPLGVIAPTILSACSNTSSYRIMNLANVTDVAIPATDKDESVTLVDNVYIINPNHEAASINIESSTISLDGAKSNLITSTPTFKKGSNNAISIVSTAKWDGTDIDSGDIVLNLELHLDNGPVITCKTNIVFKHDYWIDPQSPLWNITSSSDSKQFTLKEGFDKTSKTGFTWEVAEVPTKYKDNFTFSTSTEGLLLYSNTAAPSDSFKITITAKKDDYLIKNEIRIVGN